MIGTKRLSDIRKQIRKSLASNGQGPIQRLEGQIAAAKRTGEGTDVMEGLKRFLKAAPKRKRGKPKLTAKK